MDVRPIRNEADLDWALGEIAPYFDAEPAKGSPEADRFDVLAALIADYESRHHPIPDAPPVEIVRFYMEQNGLSQTDLAVVLGSRSRASAFLAGHRPLSLAMIDRLRSAWGLSADLLVPHLVAA